ncbi:PAS domain S-box protein [Methylobacterium pseudosasicola]|uniref:Blue-light-activated histidine kinase n=1 Tax=Methylobacterium pseudosasicola TaxID=582667 RepID=A0A1I4SHV8_9HYPH|nr:PAS domain S-box protein [Methylobacterium pseudosasicola]SFM63883.1 PAS domain S-box-containing protein [Methylobacterium pseudosasicola]
MAPHGYSAPRDEDRACTGGDEAARLRALARYRLLDTPRERDFDDIAEAAADLCETPIAVVNLVGDGRQFFKAEVGLGVRETPLETSFCRQALLQEEFLCVRDASLDPRFEGNPLVTGEPGLRFYAGALMRTAEGHPVGTVCVLDTKPHELAERQRRGLMRLARQAMGQMELRRSLREQAEQRLLHERILDSATDYAIVATDPQGLVTRWNLGAERILGWTEAEMLGRTVEAFFTPEDRARDRAGTEMRLSLEHGSASDERWHMRKDGSRFWASGEMMPLKTEAGGTIGFLKILRDRTEQRESGAALEASEMRYRSLVEVSPQVVWFGDEAGNVTYCNAYWYDYTGLPAGETGEASWLGAIHPDHREATRAAWLAAAGSGRPYEVEFPLRRADGQYRWFLSRAQPVHGADGSARSWIGTSIDIHERKFAEERFKTLTELAPAIIWFGNPDGSLSYLNDRWYAYTGQTPEQALPLGWGEVIHPDDLQRLLDVWEHARTNEVLYDTEARLRRHDGEYRWFLIRAEPMRDGAGAVVGWLGSDSDIHDRRQAEDDLIRAREQLRLAVGSTGIGIFDYDLVSDTLVWDARTRALFGLPPNAPVSYDVFLAGLHFDDRDWVDAAVKAAIDPDGPGTYDIAFRVVGLEDGIERWVAAKGQAFFEGGRTLRFIGTTRDVTQSRRADQALREAEERYRLAARATNDAIWDWNLATNHVLWNEALGEAHGHVPDAVEPTGDWWIAHIHPDDRARVDRSIHAVIDGVGTAWADEYRFRRADGSYADILDRGYVIRNGTGQAVRMIGAMLDITRRKQAEEHQRLLTGELQHRVKNTLALVQAIASQTFRNASDLGAAREAFAERLISLGRAHDILTQASWTQAPIAEVVEGALAVHRGSGASRIRSSGPDVALAAKPALALALALHELATNAAKYGALSNASGTVDLRWHVVHEAGEPRFRLSWSEQGGPPILAQPSRRGFGSRLIERSFAAEVGGEVRLTYAPTGLVCRLEAPLASMQEAGDEAAA